MKLLNETVALVDNDAPLPSNFQRLAELSLVIVVGLTGVGKSTVLRVLEDKGVSFQLLPGRREVTDEVIIPSLQKEDGETPHPVKDRVKRFEFTARYRAKYAGGMAHALASLAIDTAKVTDTIIFDGLRGLNEVQSAASEIPHARFIILDAPDTVRISRLLTRQDGFDTTTLADTPLNQALLTRLLNIPDIQAVLSDDDLQQIVQAAQISGAADDEVIKRATIIVEERRNYDSNAARIYLTRALPPAQVLVVDTTHRTATETAQEIMDWL
ncbi:MAG: ATPase [Chloroflexota bacterium]